MIRTPLIAAAIGVMLAAYPAAAAEKTPNSVTVQYKDLDLATPEGQKKLDARIKRAAEEVCKSNEVITGTRVRSPERLQCFNEARTAVRAQVAAKINEAGMGG